MSGHDELREQVHAQTTALLHTPGAFSEWNRQVQDIAGTLRLRSSVLHRHDFETCHQESRDEIAKLDTYAAEVRARYEADLIKRGLMAIGFDAEAVVEAIRETLGVDVEP